MKLALSILGLDAWFGGDLASVIPLIQLADRKGVDQLTLSDHVIMSEATDKYPYGPFPAPPDSPWFEPMVLLGAVAAATTRIRLSTGILISPLRPAVLLAKQVATLDVLSRGRIDLGVGTGWQREEYEACGVPWSGRFAYLEEQVRVCQTLWRDAPASFHGQFVSFDRLYSMPRPVQPGGVPVIFGLAPTARQFARVAELGAGWTPMERDPERLAPMVATLRRIVAQAGRDPDTLLIRGMAAPVRDADGRADLDATLAQARRLGAAGLTMVTLTPAAFCRGPDEFEGFIDRILALKH